MPEVKKQTPVHMLSNFSDYVGDWADQFYKAKKIEGVSKNTLLFYRDQLGHFLRFCDGRVIERISQITTNNIRDYLLWLGESGHNPGGVHAAYRVLKTFLRWYDDEVEPEGWRNPISKVKAPKISEEPLKPVEAGDVVKMAKTCDTSFLGRRNRAILLVLLDTGVRARELLAINLDDVNLITGVVLVRQGKGRKSRDVVMGKDTRKAVRTYLRIRTDELEALFILDDRAHRLGYGGLRELLARHAKMAGVPVPAAHDFRRAFAINMLRNGCDLVTLARLMGHRSLKVLQRYLHQITDDLQEAHRKGSPVDRLGL